MSAFSWAEVDPRLIVELVVAAAKKIGDADDRASLEGLSASDLFARAKTHLGSPPSKAFINLLVPVLRDDWLVAAPEKHAIRVANEVRLALAAASRPRVPPSRSAALEILGQRNNTKTLQNALRQEFLSAHRATVDKPVSSRSKRVKPHFTPLRGAGAARHYEPFAHQREVWDELSRLLASPTDKGVRVALPTGAGKTEAAAEWLLDRMNEDPSVRVLWLSHRKELLDQTLRRFARCAPRLPEGFVRRARAVHSEASALSTLGEKELDLAIVSIDTLAQPQRGARRRRLRSFLGRPTYIVVDEMHHAGAKGYETVLGDAFEVAHEIRGLIGLSATPSPNGAAARLAVRERFPTIAITRTVEELVRAKVLARPSYGVVRTGRAIKLTASEAATAETGDLPTTVLSRIGDPARDKVIVDAFVQDKAKWGKTLVFAPTIKNADALGELFRENDVPARVMHSRMLEDRDRTLRWFADAKGSAVLVSVGMLTEGVDLPDARTAFIARPTASYILMRQMIGRVLRGTPSGGGAEAHVVYFSDTWRGFDALEPVDAMVGRAVRGGGSDVVIDGEPVPADLIRAIRRMFQVPVEIATDAPAEDLPEEPPLIPILVPTALAGYYELADNIRIPVLAHQLEGFRELISAARRDGKLPPLLGHFADDQPPQPARRHLTMLAAEVRGGEEPAFVDLRAELGARVVAERVRRAEPLSDTARTELLEREHRETLAGAVFASFAAFRAAVEAADLGPTVCGRPTDPIRRPGVPPMPLVATSSRELGPRLDIVARRGQILLPAEIAERIGELPPVGWTARPIVTSWGYYRLAREGSRRGEAVIRVNRGLCAEPAAVSDELLDFVLWHELLHHLLPTQGHDGQFRELEGLWPSADEHTRNLDTMHERWETDPIAYGG